MEINVHFVLLEELSEKPSDSGIETNIVIICENRNADSPLEDGATDLLFPE